MYVILMYVIYLIIDLRYKIKLQNLTIKLKVNIKKNITKTKIIMYNMSFDKQINKT